MAQVATLGEVVKAVTAGAPEPLVGVRTLVKSCVIRAGKVGGANTGNIWLATTNAAGATRRIIEMAPGDVWPLPIAASTEWNLQNVYLDAATTDDGITGITSW